MGLPWWNVVGRLLEALTRPQEPETPRQIDDALERAPAPEELERWKREGGGTAGDDAPHITGDDREL